MKRPPAPPPLHIAIASSVRLPRGLSASVRRRLAEAAAADRLHGELSVMVVGDARMKRLHGEWMDLWTTTDCLTYDLSGLPPGRRRRVEGEVVVCMDVARREAARRGHAPADELLLYALHGLLHLAGEDDLEPAAARRMHAREDRLLRAIGVGAVYARPPKAGA